MRLELDTHLPEGLTSRSQLAGRVTERWVEENLYCPACPSPRLTAQPGANPVVDFACAGCGAEFQLKASYGSWGAKILGGAYEPMIKRVEANRCPHFLFLGYDQAFWRVNRLLVVPGHFITTDMIERRKALSVEAQRPGWTGCSILLGRVPPDGRLAVVYYTTLASPPEIREQWKRFNWLASTAGDKRTWLVDVLRCVRTFGGREFTMQELSAFVPALAARHPRNRNIMPKVAQQLQILRDKGIVRFISRGRYVAL